VGFLRDSARSFALLRMTQGRRLLEVWELKLERVKGLLIARGGSGAKSCLGDVRGALRAVGLRLPWRCYPWNTAIANFRVLRANPGKYGWRQVHSPLERYGLVLVYFRDCGRLGDGRIAGHVAVLDTAEGVHYANETRRMTQFWADRLVGAFVPIDEA
jgi:hypothetical protein